MLSGRGLFCDGLITHPEESYRLWRVVVCDQETPNEEAKARYGAVENTIERVVTPRKQTTCRLWSKTPTAMSCVRRTEGVVEHGVGNGGTQERLKGR